MKKLITFILTIIAAVSICSVNTEATTVYTVYESVDFVSTEVTVSNFLEIPENLVYKDETTHYVGKNFILVRFDTFLSVALVDNEGNESRSQLISGSHFVVTPTTLWYISDRREISSFEYSAFDYSTDDSFAFRESGLVKSYKNADLSSFKAEEIGDRFFKYDGFVEVDGPVAFTTTGYTVLFEDNYVTVYTENRRLSNNLIDIISFPFNIQELAFLDSDYSSGVTTYAFLLESNAVGIITITKEGELTYHCYDEGNAERHLINDEEDDDIVFVQKDGYLIYMEEGHVKAANEEFHFFMKDTEIQVQWSGDTCGVGPGFSQCSIIYVCDYDQMQEDGFNPEEAFKKAGIDL